MRLGTPARCLLACLSATLVSFVVAELDPSWQDTELSTNMWRVISSNENAELQKLLDEGKTPKRASVFHWPRTAGGVRCAGSEGQKRDHSSGHRVILSWTHTDGRGPLFWAHEANNEEAMEMLKKAGASEDWADADGKTCKEFEHGKMTEYMRKLNQARAEEMERQRQAMESQSIEIEEDDDEDDEEEEEEEEDDDDE